MITIDNDKTVVQPYVAVDGSWCAVSRAYVMVDGVWQPVFEWDKYIVRYFSYGKLLETRTCKKGYSVSFPAAPLVYGEDYSHYGWTKTYGSKTSEYSPSLTMRPTADTDFHAVYKYYPTTTENTLDLTSVTEQKTITITSRGPNTVDIEGCIEKVTRNISDDTVVKTEYDSYELNTDGTAPYVEIESQYYGGVLGNESGTTVVSVPVECYDVVHLCGTNAMTVVDTLKGIDTEYTYRMTARYRKYSGSISTRSAKE